MNDSVALVPLTGGEIIIPKEYRQDALDHVCGQIAQGRNLKDICRAKGMPSQKVVQGWLQRNSEFRQRYLDAYKVHLTLEIPSILEIADSGGEDVKRDTLMINTRIKLLEKLAPDQFGNKVQVEVTAGAEMREYVERMKREDALLEAQERAIDVEVVDA